MLFEFENLGVMIDPKFGGCKCAGCPILGSKYSFFEQKQFDIIHKNLFYHESLKRWFTQYPWKLPCDSLQELQSCSEKIVCDRETSLSQ